jgi:hypothetical protein
MLAASIVATSNRAIMADSKGCDLVAFQKHRTGGDGGVQGNQAKPKLDIRRWRNTKKISLLRPTVHYKLCCTLSKRVTTSSLIECVLLEAKPLSPVSAT